MIRRKEKKVFLYTSVPPTALDTVLIIDIYHKECKIETSEGEEFEAVWQEYTDIIESAIEDAKVEVKEKILNNNKVILSYTNENDENGIQKNNNFLNRNNELLQYLESYQV